MSDYLDTANANLLEGSVSEVRQLAEALEASARLLRGAADPGETLDEVYRAAHSLRAEAAAAGMAGLAELAGLIREAAQSMRTGDAAEGPAVLLAEAAAAAGRAARGDEADLAAAHALLARLRGGAVVTVPEGRSRRLLRVQPARLQDVASAAAAAEMAAAALTDGARTPSVLLGEAREGAARFHDAMARAAGELPALLESVRAGEPATDAARRVMDGFASAEALVAGLEDGLAAAVRQLAEGASGCASSVREVRDAAARARLVPVGPTLRALSRKVAARASLEVAGAEVEIDSALVDPVRQVLLDAVERRLPGSRRRAALVRLAVSARRQDDWIVIRLTGGRVRERGETPPPVRHAAAQIARAGGAVRSGAVAEVRVPVWPGRVRCLLLRAGGHWYGIPAASVVECLSLRRGVSPSWGGKPVPVLLLESLFSPTAPGQEAGLAELAGVIVRSGRRRACLLGEAHGGVRTVALGSPARTGQGVSALISPSAATADDGSVVTVLDPARLVRRALAPQEGGVRS